MENSTLLTESQVRDRLRAAVRDAGVSRRAWAIQNGIDDGNLSRVYNGQSPMFPQVLEAIGYERVVMYRRTG